MRTFSRSDWEAARDAWEGFGPRWSRIRKLAADAGIIYPPNGTAHDDRDAENPSQRAIIWRALEDNPTELVRIVGQSRSWSQVIDHIIGLEERLRRDAGEDERNVAWDRDDPDHKEAVMTLGAILGRIEASR